jgi:hypothetical protein
LELQKLLAENPGLEERLDRLPGRVFSGRGHPKAGSTGIFFCYALPAEDKSLLLSGATGSGVGDGSPPVPSDAAVWTTDAGKAAWYLFDLATGKIVEHQEDIVAFIRSKPETPRRVALSQAELHDVRLSVEKHIKNTYLKQVQAPAGVKPVLKCWMELN